MSMFFRNHAHEFYKRWASAEDKMSMGSLPRHRRGILLATLLSTIGWELMGVDEKNESGGGGNNGRNMI